MTNSKNLYSEYLAAIQAGEAVAARVAEILPLFAELNPEPLDRIFVTDQIDEDSGDRQFASLWAFSETFMMEGKAFLTATNCDIATFREEVSHVTVTLQDYDLGSRTRKASRMSIEASFGTGGFGTLTAQLSATSANCSFLAKIMTDVLRPNLRRPVVSVRASAEPKKR